MGKASSMRLLTCNPLAPLVLLYWLMASGFCSPKDFHPGSFQCKPFDEHRIRIKCSGIKHVPRDLPPNTAILDLSSNQQSSIQEFTFRNLTMLKEISLSGNKLTTFPQSTFHLPNLTRMYV
ncbi:Decorin [Stylophora pistillata]|uniref:Decorin n=1 Tax=Stylophora pistillata TaxID=50429 RepID=A0A2B4RAA8_STYPI|nr:Decorin [Stylophora pistillata]